MKIDFLLGIVILIGLHALVRNIASDMARTRWFYPLYNWLLIFMATGYVMTS